MFKLHDESPLEAIKNVFLSVCHVYIQIIINQNFNFKIIPKLQTLKTF